jgi:hypothetical protein
MPTYKWIAALVLVAIVVGFPSWLFLLRRSYSRFFDPAIDDADRALAAFAQSVNGNFVPSVRRWREVTPLASSFYEYTNNYAALQKAYRGDGGAKVIAGGFPTRVSWIIVALDNGFTGFALLPRVRVDLPVGVSFSGMRDPRSAWPRSPFDLLAKGVYGVGDHGPRIQLTPREQEAFTPLRARACRIYVSTTTTGNPVTGAMPEQYPLYLEVWGETLQGEPSPRALERSLHGWREDFSQKELSELVASAVAFAQTATASSGALQPGR